MRGRPALAAVLMAAGLAAGCTGLSDEDRALLNQALSEARAAQDTANQALAAAQAAQAQAAGSAQAAQAAQLAAQNAEANAAAAAQRADRMFSQSLRK
ncbi:hypothetical protein [Zavarzinia sp. CC-PAN008]|uniref:hypothetical protein n=1 Tax=Zavarzinia sp. CC-PAN008 TaxID=3243332 RepID=UPI003F749560